jgi:hypothetical protein
MKTKIILLILPVIVASLVSNAQIPTFQAGSLVPHNFTACTNPITMDFGASAYDFTIGDPITFFIDFGDGTNYTAPVQFIANISDSLFSVVELFGLVKRLGGMVNPEFLERAAIDFGQDDGRMGLGAPEFGQLSQSQFSERIRDGRNG